MIQIFKRISILILFSTMIFVVIGGQKLAAQTKGGAADFYKGATVNFIVTYAPGAAYDLWARALAPQIEKYTGARVLVHNMPGAAGLVGGAHLYSLAKPDGLTIGILPMPGMVVAEMLEFEAVKFELDKFSFIGRVEVMDRALFASKASGFKSIADMQKATKTIRFGTVDPTSLSSVEESLFAEAFGLKAKIIPGYKGSKEYILAVIAGRELEAAVTSLAGYNQELVKKGELSLLAVMGKKRNPDFPEVPTFIESPGIKPEGKKLIELLDILIDGGRMIVAPPGVPEERRLFLERALSVSLKEPAIEDWAKKGEYYISPLSGKECKVLIEKLKEIVPKPERPKVKHIVTEKFF
ncbi:MAG: tripartite tricarboxylate transporter substrate-binding protein [Thermodesulfobacteriota bacterium]|nr:tripartite tricarboxylate transporter substrate-binding protein [Thermodesulfobacteriota bacterium]